MLETSPEVFVKRTILNPRDMGLITTRECRGKRGLPVVSKQPFNDVIDEFPEIKDRLVDVSLGLVSSLYGYGFVKNVDLPNFDELDKRDQEIDVSEEKLTEIKEQKDVELNELEDKYNKLKDSKDEIINDLEYKYNRLKDIRIENSDNTLLEKHNNLIRKYNGLRERFSELIDERDERINELEDENNKLNDELVELND